MLPFIAGVAAGAAVVVAYNNRKEVIKTIDTGAEKLKEFVESGYEKSKDIASDIKENISDTIESIGSKKEDNK